MKIEPKRAYELFSPRLILLVTTVGSEGGINAAPISWSTPISFDPSIVMISLAPTRHTYKNVRENKEFVINILGKEHLDQVLRCAAKFPIGVNELEQAGLKWYSSQIVKVPRVKEAKAWVECKLLEEEKMGDHIAVFGLVVAAEVRDEVTTEGKIDFDKISPAMHISKDRFAIDFKVIKHKRYD